MAQNLLAYYCFNDNSGFAIKDFSINERHGVGTSMTITTDTGAVGKVGEFNGTSSKVVITDFSEFDALTSCTIVAKFKVISFDPDGDAATNIEVITFRDSNFHVLITTDGKLQFVILTPTDSFELNDTNILNINTWYTVIATWDGANMKLYLNSLDNPSTLPATGTLTSNANDLVIGADISANWFNGQIEMISYYNRAITDAEIVTILEQPSGLKYIAIDDKLGTGDLLLNNFGGKEVVTWYEEFDERNFSDAEEHLFSDEEQMMFHP